MVTRPRNHIPAARRRSSETWNESTLPMWVSGTPKAQPRPRAFARRMSNGAVSARVYDACTAESWKSDIIRDIEPFRPDEPLEGPLELRIEFHLPRPKALCRKSDPDGPVWCTRKPDRDNLEKAVLDAMKTVGWFRDDAQVVAGEVRKLYHAKGGVPGAWITVRVLREDEVRIER